mgnify:CR=1 FL=1
MEEREEIYNKIVERLTAMVGEKDYTEATEYAELNLKSGNYSQMINVLEDEFDVEIPYMEFKRSRTIGDSVNFIVSLIDG